MEFTELYTEKHISKRLNNGDWDYWLVIDITDMDDATGDITNGKYLVSINAVSPKAAGKKNLMSAMDCCGIRNTRDILVKVEALNDYGVHANLFYKYGNDQSALLNEAKEECKKIEGLFGFYMDQQQNLIGNNGWDFISGNIGFKK